MNSNNCFKTATGDTIFLLKISWPNISNAEHIDFDFYTLQINAGGESFTIRTTATSYEHVLYIRTQEVSNLDANITIDAVNRCNGTSNDPLQVSYTLNKGIIVKSISLHQIIFFYNVM